MTLNAKLPEVVKIVQGLGPITPSTSVPDYVSLKDYAQMSIIISVDNGTSPTGSAITLLQASAVANTGEKALAFSTMWANLDTSATDTLVATAVTSNTFTVLNTNNTNALYVIDIDADDLDRTNSFDCVRLGTGNGTNSVTDVIYILRGPRYASPAAISAITD